MSTHQDNKSEAQVTDMPLTERWWSQLFSTVASKALLAICTSQSNFGLKYGGALASHCNKPVAIGRDIKSHGKILCQLYNGHAAESRACTLPEYGGRIRLVCLGKGKRFPSLNRAGRYSSGIMGCMTLEFRKRSTNMLNP